MKMTRQGALSKLSNAAITQQRINKQTLQVLSFIHRFRHVTARHVQLSIGHANTHSTSKLLFKLVDKQLIAQQFGSKSGNRTAAYYLTANGRQLIAERMPAKYRKLRSLMNDAAASLPTRLRNQTLADVYAHFKRHYDGKFEFFTSFDIAGLEGMPNEIPDGYIKLKLPRVKLQHYFVEIYGWGRSSYVQQRRLNSYLEFAESERWQAAMGQPLPGLFIVVSSQLTQRRLNDKLSKALNQSLAEGFRIYTTVAGKLDSEESIIWRAVS